MSAGRGTHATPPFDDRALTNGCREIAGWLDAASTEEPQALQQTVARAERAVVHLRDGLIDRLRAVPLNTDTTQARAALARINGALSLIVGVEYPSGRIEHKLLGQASAALREVASKEG